MLHVDTLFYQLLAIDWYEFWIGQFTLSGNLVKAILVGYLSQLPRLDHGSVIQHSLRGIYQGWLSKLNILAAVLCKDTTAFLESTMASQTGFCGDGCSFDTMEIDCSMAFRMVESTMKRIMSGLRERRENEAVFAGLIKSDLAVSAVVHSQHTFSKFLTSVAPHSNSSSSSQIPYSYPSTAPLLPQLRSILQGLEELSLQESPQAASTPFAAASRTREAISDLTGDAVTGPTHYPLTKLSYPEFPDIQASALSHHHNQARRELYRKAKGELGHCDRLPVVAKWVVIDIDTSEHIFISPRSSKL